MSNTEVRAEQRQPTPSPDLPSSVLVAEDEHLVAADLAQYLRSLEIEVVGPASNGRDALELAESTPPAMALVDIRMPAMDGLEAADILYNRMGIPVVFVSAYTDPEYLHNGAKAGVFGYMLKPLTFDDLRVTLAVAWSRANQQARLHGQVQELRTALENRKLVERAKGLLMDHLGLGEQDAMRRLQKQARDSRRTLPDLARAILESDQLLNQGKEKTPDA